MARGSPKNQALYSDLIAAALMCSSVSGNVSEVSCSISIDDPQRPFKENPGFRRRVIEPDLCLETPRHVLSTCPERFRSSESSNPYALQLAPSGRSSSFYPASRRWLTIPAPLVRYLWTLPPKQLMKSTPSIFGVADACLQLARPCQPEGLSTLRRRRLRIRAPAQALLCT